MKPLRTLLTLLLVVVGISSAGAAALTESHLKGPQVVEKSETTNPLADMLEAKTFGGPVKYLGVEDGWSESAEELVANYRFIRVDMIDGDNDGELDTDEERTFSLPARLFASVPAKDDGKIRLSAEGLTTIVWSRKPRSGSSYSVEIGTLRTHLGQRLHGPVVMKGFIQGVNGPAYLFSKAGDKKNQASVPVKYFSPAGTPIDEREPIELFLSEKSDDPVVYWRTPNVQETARR